MVEELSIEWKDIFYRNLNLSGYPIPSLKSGRAESFRRRAGFQPGPVGPPPPAGAGPPLGRRALTVRR